MPIRPTNINTMRIPLVRGDSSRRDSQRSTSGTKSGIDFKDDAIQGLLRLQSGHGDGGQPDQEDADGKDDGSFADIFVHRFPMKNPDMVLAPSVSDNGQNRHGLRWWSGFRHRR